MRFDPESGTAARQQHAATSGFGGYGGPTGAGYGGPTGAGYGGPTGAGYGGPTGAGYGGPTGAASGGAYGGLTGGYTNGATGGTPRGTANGTVTASSLKDCGADDLLERLPRVQRLMLRMLACVPEGAATTNALCLVGVASARGVGFGKPLPVMVLPGIVAPTQHLIAFALTVPFHPRLHSTPPPGCFASPRRCTAPPARASSTSPTSSSRWSAPTRCGG